MPDSPSGLCRLLVKTRSYLREIESSAWHEAGPGTGASASLTDRRCRSLSDSERVEKLSPAEISSYRFLDSLVAQTNLRRLKPLFDTPSLISGRIPMGAINLVLRPFLLYHAGEGWRPQIGVETSDRVSSWVRLRVWGGYGTKRQAGSGWHPLALRRRNRSRPDRPPAPVPSRRCSGANAAPPLRRAPDVSSAYAESV
jgi:hypothetical protein